MANTIADLFAERIRPFGRGERTQFKTILESIDQAQRLARRLDNDIGPDRSRLPKLGEFGRLPGTGNAGGETLTYTVRIRTADRSGDGRNSFLVVITDSAVLSGSEVRARALQAVEQGTAATRVSYNTANPQIVLPDSVEIVSVYKGTLNV